MMDAVLNERKEKLLNYLKKVNPLIFIYFVLAGIAAFGFYIRTRNLGYLVDVTTGKFIPSDPDAIGILRYVKYVLENGSMMNVDYMRYFPNGYTGLSEFGLLSHLIVYFYKFLHFFSSAVTIEYADIIYPAYAFVIALVFFFLWIKKMFDWKVAILASAFLTVLPAYLFRTMSGVSDKEAMAMIFMYLGLFLFISFILEKNWKKALLFSILAGLSVGCLWWIWGGVNFVLMTIGLFVIILIILNKLSSRNLGLFSVFLVLTWIVLRLGFPERANLLGLLTSTTTAVLFFALILGLVQYLLFNKDILKIKNKIKFPSILLSLGIVIGVALLGIIILYGPSYIIEKGVDVYIDLVEPFGRNRWALTVAESQQPYFTDWIGQFTLKYLLLVFVGAVLLFYEIFKKLGKRAYYITIAYTAFLLAFTLNRYSSSSTLNGETGIAIFLYIGSLIFFGLYLIYFLIDLRKNSSEDYINWLEDLNYGYIFFTLLFVLMLVGARSAVRLLFVFAPATAILAAFAILILVKYSMKLKDKNIKYGVWIALAIFVIFILNIFTQTTLAQASSSGNSFSPQWQYGMDWVRNNTLEDAVFAHWWDYGYFVQTMGERATLSDGGNAVAGINHLIGRHLITGQNDTEALELLYAKNATHVIMVSDEIGKYGAFSSIGADANYDRYSWITSFGLDMTQTQETRNGTNLVYTGGTNLDDDFMYNGMLFPAYSSGVVGFMIPMNSDGTFKETPTVVLYNAGQYYYAPLNCIFINGQEIDFENENGFNACLMLIPSVSGSQVNPIGTALYLSPEVRNTWLTKHYLFGQDNENFKLVYSDEASVPLMNYNGRIVGPLKIWEVSYPSDLVIPEDYYTNTIDESVNTIKKF